VSLGDTSPEKVEGKMVANDGNLRDHQVDTVLAYYQAARAELLERLNIRANISMLYIAAIGAVASFWLSAPLEQFYVLPTVIPFLAWGAATLWFQQNQVMDELSKYCAKTLCPYIEQLWKERREASKYPPSIDQVLFPLRERKSAIQELFSAITEVAFPLFAVPQVVLAWIGIGIALWREEGGGGRLTNLPGWAIPTILFVVWLAFFALTMKEIIDEIKRQRSY